MAPTAVEIVAAHARISPLGDLLRDRRTLYRALADAVGEPELGRDDSLLDSALVRGHLGARFSGALATSHIDRAMLADHVASGFSIDLCGGAVRMASAVNAGDLVAPAVDVVHEILRLNGDTTAAAAVLTVEHGARATEAFAMIVAGARLVATTCPALLMDLLPHIDLFVVTDREISGRLGSASAREFPGMILLPEPVNAAEAAEAIVHEGAHQKYFDLAMTRDILGEGHREVEPFAPPWAARGGPGWPIEQCVAAWHAYTCLTVLAAAFTEGRVEPAPGSLLAFAPERAAVLGSWLAGHASVIGVDGRRLVTELAGCALQSGETQAPTVEPRYAASYASGGRRLLVTTTSDIYWSGT